MAELRTRCKGQGTLYTIGKNAAVIGTLIFLACISVTCNLPFSDTLTTVVYDRNVPSYWVEDKGLSVITPSTPISIHFSESIDPDSLQISNEISNIADYTWKNGNTDNDQLVIKPKQEWQQNSSISFEIDCCDLDGFAVPTIIKRYTVIPNTIYVHDRDGNDTNPGTQTKPVKTIQHGIDILAALYSQGQVYIAESVYEIDVDMSTIDVKDGITLKGGFAGNDWAVCDPAVYPTVIKNTTDNHAHNLMEIKNNPTGIVLDGLTIKHSMGNVINCSNSSLVIKNCIIEIEAKKGIIATNSQVEITQSSLNAPVNATNTTALDMYRCSMSLSGLSIDIAICSNSQAVILNECNGIIERSTIDIGRVDFQSVGLWITDCSSPEAITVRNNIIRSDHAGGDSSDGTGENFGIHIQNSNCRIYNNTIKSGTSPTTTTESKDIEYIGIYAYSGDDIKIVNNLITLDYKLLDYLDMGLDFGSGFVTYGLKIGTPATISSLSHNAFYRYDNGFALVGTDVISNSTGLDTALTDLGLDISDVETNIVNIDPVVDETTYIPLDGMPNAVSAGGKNMSLYYQDDLFDGIRPANGGWTIGAVQQ